MKKLFGNVYQGKRVLVTGHTGFKGSWLSAWLLELGAHVAGYSLDIPSHPSNFEALGLEKKLANNKGDIRDLAQLTRVFNDFSPDFIFHLAAQSITRLSYDIPQETFFTNLGGTVNVLECIKKSESVKGAVIITSDKCYQNVEWIWGYRENDRLGGNDPYSSSKACAEMACHAYIKSFFPKGFPPRVSTVRAGNVVGGGDWATDRIVPDCVRAFSNGKVLVIRNPKATRPWQYVLEPLSGYLWLGANLLQNNDKVAGESFNFGPSSEVDRTVEDVIKEIAKLWRKGKWKILNASHLEKKESSLLKLNCDKAFQYLGWRAVLSFQGTIHMTVDWYKAFYKREKDLYGYTVKQIEEYTDIARKQGLNWAQS